MNFGKKMALFGPFCLLLLILCTAGNVFGQELNKTDNLTKIIETTAEAPILNKDQKLMGKLIPGVQISVDTIQDGKVYFQWNGELVFIEEQNAKVVESENVTFTSIAPMLEESQGKILTHAETNVFSDAEFSTSFLKLEPNLEYGAVKAEEDYYMITVGNRAGFVKAEEVEYINEENGLASSSEANSVSTEEPDSIYKNSASTAEPDGLGENDLSQNTLTSSNNPIPVNVPAFSSTDRYFEVTVETVPIYDNSTGVLVEVGRLNKGQVFQRVSDYGDWHQIKFGNGFGYVWKASTVPASGTSIKNLNNGLSNTNLYFIPQTQLTVYDNSSGSLIPFASLKANIQYPILSDYGDWYQIDVAGRIGYVYKPATTRPFMSSDRYFQVMEDKVGIYDNSTGALVRVGELKKGQVYPRVSDYGDWHQIKFGNEFGYVWEASTVPASSSFIPNPNTGLTNSTLYFLPKQQLTVYDNSTGSLVPFASLNANIQYPVLSDYGDWYQIDVAGRIGYVYKPATTRPFMPSDLYFQVMEDKVGIYDNSTGVLLRVGELSKGQVYPRVSDYGDWHQIKFGNGFGYVWEASTTPANNPLIQNLNPGLKNSALYFLPKQQLTVYDNSTGSLVPFASLNANIQYPVLSDYGDWYQIDVGGRIGYVYKPATTRPFFSSDQFFQVVENYVGIYDNSTGTLVRVGELTKGQVYPRVSDYGDWHQIKFGNRFGYIWKGSTIPAAGNMINNLNTGSSNSKNSFFSMEKLTVYDNSTGSLVPFATINENVQYPIISDYGDWYQIDVSGRIGYVYKEAARSPSGPLEGKVIVIDAGHGGSDPGASGVYNLEKNLTLSTSLELGAILEEAGAKVIYTRDSDVYPTLQQRVDISKAVKPDVFISIHFNSYTNKSTNGIETYYYDAVRDQRLANEIHLGILNQVGLADRGVRFGDLFVLRENSQPSVLLELGFISNPQEEALIATTAYQKRAAQGILNGLIKYFE
ncbi:N-acetylmuramoyl-L-alanine amidase [Neobacillus sp. SAB-20_R2A]|uniref:N-acetylmuramoyl-L-alanine amidase n=1 Tax=Neobacillus sp. SAB-20_R2A TaxID=3120519 RepID=UPI003C6E0192